MGQGTPFATPQITLAREMVVQLSLGLEKVSAAMSESEVEARAALDGQQGEWRGKMEGIVQAEVEEGEGEQEAWEQSRARMLEWGAVVEDGWMGQG